MGGPFVYDETRDAHSCPCGSVASWIDGPYEDVYALRCYSCGREDRD